MLSAQNWDKTQVTSWLPVLFFFNFKLIDCKFSFYENLNLSRLWSSGFRSSRRTFSDTCHSKEIGEIPLSAERKTLKFFLKCRNRISFGKLGWSRGLGVGRSKNKTSRRVNFRWNCGGGKICFQNSVFLTSYVPKTYLWLVTWYPPFWASFA